jgi:hypothetical protein
MERDFTNWSDGGRAFERMADLWPVSRRDEAPTAAEVERVKNGTVDPPAKREPHAPAYSREELVRIARADLAFRLDVLGLFLSNRKTQVASIDSLQNATNPGT